MKVAFTETALAKVEEIFAYVAAQNPPAADRIVARIEQVISRIGEFPHMGHSVDEPDVRIVPVGRFPYLIFYAVTDVVTILHVRHAARLRP
jgi:toxin ParE1/3/4